MDYAQRDGDSWRLLVPGQPVQSGEIVTSYDAVTSWSDTERADWDIEAVGPGAETPVGQHLVSSSVIDRAGHPVWKNVFEDDEIPPAPPRLSISDRQFFQALAMEPYSLITTQAALDAVKTGEIPAIMASVIDQLPPDAQFDATMKIAGGTIFNRTDPLVEVFGASQGMGSDQIDQFWDFAGAL